MTTEKAKSFDFCHVHVCDSSFSDDFFDDDGAVENLPNKIACGGDGLDLSPYVLHEAGEELVVSPPYPRERLCGDYCVFAG